MSQTSLRPRRTPPAHRQTGTSLIEVLVALLILTAGLLAMAAQTTSAVRFGKMAEFKTNATMLAEDLGERMRANVGGARAGNYVYQEAWSADLPEQTLPALDCTEDCGADVAAYDIADWINQARPMLPGLGLWTDQPEAGGSVMDVWVAWQEPTEAQAEDADPSPDDAINAGYACPDDMGADSNVRCMHFRFTL